MLKNVLLILAALLFLATAEVRVGKEHTSTRAPPQGWELTRKADANHATRITIAITQQNLEELDRKFWQVSDPKSKYYGQHMSFEEVKRLVAPTQQSISSITTWLESNGITLFELANSADFLFAYGTVAQFESLLGTSYHVYRHSATGQELVRALAPYTVPASVGPHVDFVGGLTHFPKRAAISKNLERAPLVSVTPSVIKKFFGIEANLVGNSSNNTQAVAQFLQQYYAPSDLANFQKKYSLPSQPVELIVGPNQPANPGIEASLDIEYIMAMAPLVPTWFVYTDGLHEGQEPFLDWIVNMSSTPNAPWVHSVSYGDDEDSISHAYTLRVDVEFEKFGVTGHSILFASGDDGTGCSNDCKTFIPNWPASSPYVTTVGGIQLNSNGNGATADEISSGGFSNYFPQPSYQAAAVTAYLQAHPNSPAPSAYNASGRAMPDIASFSEDVIIEFGGSLTGVAGTSCAAPVISGVISLLNDARLSAGKPTLGFLNPFIYQTLAAHPDAFIDITEGNNQDGCCAAGFNAATGWDPITGVGAPNFPNLLKYALAV